MKESCNAYLPRDRLVSLATGMELPERAEGSVLFADISGFTPLTEAYEAHLGSRRGGEELTRVLNEVYADLIGEVERMRGSVIGFAGDAITCWFDGDDGRRATSAALAMQRGMGRFQAIPSPAGGTLGLGLKAAVTTGKVRRFVVGQSDIQRVDVLAGDPVYRVAVIEQLAQRGEVLVDLAAHQALGAAAFCSDQRRDDVSGTMAWVVQSIQPIEGVEPWPPIEAVQLPDALVDPWILAAMRSRHRSGLGDFLTELRPAATLFMKFAGIDFENDEQAAAKLDAFFSAAQRIVSGLGGVIHQLTLGDKGSFLYAAFGAPVSHEDDTRRTLAAALSLRAMAASNPDISGIRLGIGRGTTRTGAYGGPTRKSFGVLGDQVNLAARLMGKAEIGQILISDSAAREVEGLFRLRELPPMRVKGKSMPITVHSVEGEMEDQARRIAVGTYALPMVGRARELEEIRGLLDVAASGLGQAVILTSDAGLGKSRLTAEVVRCATAAGFRMFQGECQTFGTNTLYAPWWPVWREFFGLTGREDPEQVAAILRDRLSSISQNLVPRIPLLGPVLNIDLLDNQLTRTFDSKLRRASLDALLVECLRAEAARQPVLILLEDVHGIDPVSRDLLRMLIQAVARQRVLLLLVGRPRPEQPLLGPDEQGLDYVRTIILSEFTEAESATLIRMKFRQLYGEGPQLPDSSVSRLTDKTGGNPFFIEEVMNWMHHKGIDALSVDALESADLPVSLHSLVLSRMDQLEEGARVTLKVASVIGRLFRASIIWGVYPELGSEAEVRKNLDELSAGDFTAQDSAEPELTYLFRHVVIQEVAYESLPMRLRSRLHELIGLFVENRLPSASLQVLDILAFHFGRSDNTAKKREYFLKAGDAARSSYANEAAAGYYRALLPLLEEGARIPVLQNLGRVLEFAGDWKAAMEQYEAALELAARAGEARAETHCQLLIGDLLRKSGALDEAGQCLEVVQEAFSGLGDEVGLGQALHSAGTLAAQTGRYDHARDLYTRSMEIRRRYGDESKVASLLSNVGIIARFQGRVDEALALQQESLEIRRRLRDAWAVGNSLNNLGMAKRYKGDFSGARADLEEALRILQKVGDRAEIANTLNSLAEVALDQGDISGSEHYLQESLRLTRELGNVRAIAFLFEAFASNAFMQQRPERCLRLLGAARALRAAIGAPLPQTDCARIDKMIAQAAEALQAQQEIASTTGSAHTSSAGTESDAEGCLNQGASMPLSAALDFAGHG